MYRVQNPPENLARIYVSLAKLIYFSKLMLSVFLFI